jgi:hypothetical protein
MLRLLVRSKVHSNDLMRVLLGSEKGCTFWDPDAGESGLLPSPRRRPASCIQLVRRVGCVCEMLGLEPRTLTPALSRRERALSATAHAAAAVVAEVAVAGSDGD